MAQGIMLGNGGGGNRYSLLTVTTEESTLQSESVTITGTDPVTGKVDTQTKRLSNGTVTVKLKYLTTYTITCGEATEEVDVTAYADYTAEIMLIKWIYNNGVGQGNITIINKGYSTTIGNEDGSIDMRGSSSQSSVLRSTEKLDLSRYQYLVVVAKSSSTSTSTTATNSSRFQIVQEENDTTPVVGVVSGSVVKEYTFPIPQGVTEGYIRFVSGLSVTLTVYSIALR